MVNSFSAGSYCIRVNELHDECKKFQIEVHSYKVQFRQISDAFEWIRETKEIDSKKALQELCEYTRKWERYLSNIHLHSAYVVLSVKVDKLWSEFKRALQEAIDSDENQKNIQKELDRFWSEFRGSLLSSVDKRDARWATMFVLRKFELKRLEIERAIEGL